MLRKVCMRIDILVRTLDAHSYEHYAAKKLYEQLSLLGLEPALFHCNGAYLYERRQDRPNWTIAFEELFIGQKPLCEILQIPHFHWERDNLEKLQASHFYHIGFHKKLEGVHWIPLPAESFLCERKLFEIVLFLDLCEETAALVESLEGRLALFGEHRGANWLVRLKNRDQVELHRSLPFVEQLRVLSMSRFALLNDQDPLYPFAVLSGCLPSATPLPEEERVRRLECLTKKVLQEHSWRLSALELLRCLSQ